MLKPRRNLWQKLQSLSKTVAVTAAYVKDGESYLSIIQELVAKEKSSMANDEDMFHVLEKLQPLEGFRALQTNLKKGPASTPNALEVANKLVSANGQLTKWVHEVACPGTAEILIRLQKHIEQTVLLDPEAKTTAAAEIYSQLDPTSMGFPVELSVNELKLLCHSTSCRGLIDMVGR